MTKASRAKTFVQLKPILNVLGALMFFCGISMAFALAFALYYGDNDAVSILVSMVVTVLVGLLLWSLTRTNTNIRVKDGFVVVTFSWLVMAAFGALPFYISGSIPSYTDAFFETMSGFTTTGATILTDVESLPHGLLFWRSFTHWLGGMGIILLSLAILPMLGVGGMQLYKAEMPGPTPDKLRPRIRDTAKILWGVYVILSLAETLLLLVGGMSLFDALCHTFGTMATGGFSTKSASIGYYNSLYIEIVIIFFMILAGTNFALHYRAFTGQLRSYQKSEEFRFYIGILLIAIIFIMVDNMLSHNEAPGRALRDSAFQVVSILTTTGYGTADFEQWSTASQITLLVLMFVGGCAGSTSGAIKIMRLVTLIKQAFADIKKNLHPNAIIPVRLEGKAVPPEVVTSILTFFTLFILIFTISSVLMAFIGLDFVSAIAAVAATLGNVGPGLGSVGPTDNYAHIPAAGKLLLSFCMLLGRLEIYTVLVIFSGAFWKK